MRGTHGWAEVSRERKREIIEAIAANRPTRGPVHADAADYARMMKVKPALFDKVLENILTLVAMRGDSSHPSIVVQFLMDKRNVHQMVDMYELGRSLGPDRIALNAVLEIPRARIDRAVLRRARPEA